MIYCMNIITGLSRKNLIQPPNWLEEGTHFLVYAGSHSYGTQTDESDFDVKGFVIPPLEILLPFRCGGRIEGFDNQSPPFEQFQHHHVIDKDAASGKGREYDIVLTSITKFFKLAMDGNPNIVDVLYSPQHCVLVQTDIGKRVVDRRNIFLSKKMYHTFKGYSYSQIHKMQIKKPQGERKKSFDEFGYNVKYALHLVRLLDEIEEILETGTLTLGRNREQLKSIRRGEWSQEKILTHFNQKERYLEDLYGKSELRPVPDENAIKQLLIDCIQMQSILIPNMTKNNKLNILTKALTDIRTITESVVHE